MSVNIDNKHDSFDNINNIDDNYRSNTADQQLHNASPDNRDIIACDEKQMYSSVNKHSYAKPDPVVPNTRDQLKRCDDSKCCMRNVSELVSPARGSYSARRQQQKSYMLNNRAQSASKQDILSSNHTYSATALHNKHMVRSGSKQMPTFRPYYQHSVQSNKKSAKCKHIPKYRRKADRLVIGKDSTGKSIHLQHMNDNITIDLLPAKHKQYQRQRISVDDEDQTRRWLKQINFHGHLANADADLMQDPLRNGVLLCELICFVENVQLFDVCYSPKVIKDCRDNIDKFYAVCSHVDRLRQSVPPSLLSNRELILKGDHATVWGLLNCLRRLYPDMLPRANVAYLENTLPYTNKELVALEASLLNWLCSCGAVKQTGKQPTSLLEVEDGLKSGVIYCRLVQIMFNTKLAGVFADPKTEATKLSNLRKATDVLKQCKSMSQKYTWAERDIARGSRECMLGLLEDMHILFDGYPPRQAGRYFENGPHIGRVYDQINRKPLYHQKPREDICAKEVTDNAKGFTIKSNFKNIEVKDFIGEAKKKFISDFKTARNDSRDLTDAVSESDYSSYNNIQNNSKLLFTERYHRKHENVPSIINNQKGKDV